MRKAVFALMIVLAGGCSPAEQEGFEIFTISYDFFKGAQQWESEFTDYPVSEYPQGDTVYRWKAEYLDSPGPTNGVGAYMLSCNNVSGDVFMFLKRKMSGLRPNTNYNVVFDIRLVTDADPGQGIILKVGASDLEPKKVIEDNYYVFNLDKGLDAASGEDALSLGDIGYPSPNDSGYSNIVKGNATNYEPFQTRTNSQGELWIFAGVDSFYQGINTIYVTKIDLVLSVSE
jgi:hypothetical protein